MKPHRSIFASCLILLVLGAVSCTRPPCVLRPLSKLEARTIAARAKTFPGIEWDHHARPEAAGYDGAALSAVSRELRGLATSGLLAVVDGKVLLEYGDVRSSNYVASVRKSVLSILIGIAEERGELNLDATLETLRIDDVGGLLPKERQARVRDLLGARSGIYHPASFPGDALEFAPARGSQEPGSYFLYSNWDFNALGTIYERATRTTIYSRLESDLGKPLGMQDFVVSEQHEEGDARASEHLAYSMLLSTRDLARLGHLMLMNGRWNDVQVVSPKWVEKSTSMLTKPEQLNPPAWRSEGLGYGYLWWILDEPEDSPLHDAYSAQGAAGQFLVVVPRLGLVVAHEKSESAPGRVEWTEFRRIVCGIVNSRLPAE